MSFWSKFADDREKSINPVHIVMGFLVLNAIGWVWYLVLKTHLMPELSGVAMILGGGGVANLAHKADDIIAKFKNTNETTISVTK